jgi:hypothetical protein
VCAKLTLTDATAVFSVLGKRQYLISLRYGKLVNKKLLYDLLEGRDSHCDDADEPE